jgi:hypothetical protein
MFGQINDLEPTVSKSNPALMKHTTGIRPATAQSGHHGIDDPKRGIVPTKLKFSAKTTHETNEQGRGNTG